MALPSTGAISASMINLELGKASNAQFNIAGSDERGLADKPSGTISFADFRGKSAWDVVISPSAPVIFTDEGLTVYAYIDCIATGAPTPTAYSWSITGDSSLSIYSGGTTATVRLKGRSFIAGEFTATLTCTVNGEKSKSAVVTLSVEPNAGGPGPGP